MTNSELNLETKRLIHAFLIFIENILSDKEKAVSTEENIIEDLISEKNKIKIAFFSANPKNENPLRLEKEMRDIDDAIRRSFHPEMIEFRSFTAARIRDLQNCLLEFSPNFVHFSGHGNADGIALLDALTDNAQLVKTDPLANLFKLFSKDIVCVFLNSCYSSSQGEQIRKFIPHVIGMKHAVPDSTAIEFATTFYKAIALGKDIDFSFEFAKNSIDLHDISGSDIPVLH